MKRTEASPEDIKRTTDLIRRTGAMRAVDVCQALGFSRDYCNQVLAACRGLKRARIDLLTHYMTPAECSSRKKVAAAAKKARWAANSRKALEAAKAPTIDASEDGEDWPMKRLVVPAAYALPMRTNAARWVFDWRPE